MAVAYDNFAKNETNGTGDFSISLTPVGTASGILVYVVCNGSGTDEITSVNLNGTVGLTQTASSPVLKTTGETASSHCFFVGTGIPAGALTINVVTSGTASTKVGYAVSLTASQDTSVVTAGSVNSDATINPAVTLSLGGVTCFCALGAMSGQNNPASVTPLSSWTSRSTFDFGVASAVMFTYDTIGSTDVSAGYTAGNDDVVLHAVAIRENAAGGVVIPTMINSYRQRRV